MDAVSQNNPVLQAMRSVLDGPLFATDSGGLTGTFQEGHPDSRVILIVGDNAAGKSLVIRVLASKLNTAKVEPLQVSMKYRTAPGMHRSFMFGPCGDSEDSTGNISLGAIKGAFRTAEARSTPTWVMLDEPDTGLADGYCAAMGTYLANFGNRLPLNECQGLAVVSHSRKLMSAMTFSLQLAPHVVCLADYQSDDILQAWLEDERERTVEELLALGDASLARWRVIEGIINRSKQK